MYNKCHEVRARTVYWFSLLGSSVVLVFGCWCGVDSSRMRRIRNQSPRKFLKNSNKRDESRIKLNERINANQLIVIDEKGTKIGVLSRVEALQMIESKELDLLVVSDQGEIPVAKIVNCEKYRYEQQKKQKRLVTLLMTKFLINTSELLESFERYLKGVSNLKSLYVARNTFFNQNVKPLLNEIKKQKTLDEKKQFGLEYNTLNEKLTIIFEERLRKINEERLKKDKDNDLDVDLPCADLSSGVIHPLNSVVNDNISFLDFDVYIGDELTTTEFCFDALNIPLNHVTRSFRTTLYLTGSKEKLLRTHCTASTVKFIHENPADEIKVITFGNVYRNDTEDATHSIQFKQIDFMWLCNDLTVANLK
ncbi:translation initiation factor IF-3 protein [Dictyocaulus viviparus]|uniref:Translation initiation factor IF-3 protein n=1 Tax=Dictyocaulus viviparus TaxID=29172 RepID=A0A0D8XIJ4_DICVI|nr:translation initiation factor IF-3 protein [Dictyocaulus viviparus]